jgi:hypothetical protein
MGTAEVSLIVSGLAALGSIAAVVITYRLGRQRFDHERRLADLDAVRRVLDDAAACMQRLQRMITVVYMNLDAYAKGAEGSVYSLVHENQLAVEAAYNDLEAHQARLEIRFGSEHELVFICRIIEEAMIGVLKLTARIKESPEQAQAVEEHRGPAMQAVQEVSLALKNFTLTAYHAVGVRLPAKELHEV